MASSRLSSRPNILWITTDQQRFDSIAALGHAHMHTPNLDRLVHEGVAFTHAYCQSPVCTPSRASFMAGMYASALHQNRNGAAYFPPPYRGELPLVTRLLADSGYSCGLVGKLDLTSDQGGRERRADDGFGYVQYSSRPDLALDLDQDYHHWLRAKGQDPKQVLGRRADDRDAIARYVPPAPDDDCTPVELHHTYWCAEKAMEFISMHTEGDESLHGTVARPWLLCLNIFYPHPPYDPPWEYYRRFDPSANFGRRTTP